MSNELSTQLELYTTVFNVILFSFASAFYLLAWRTRTMTLLLEPGSKLNILATFYYRLGWESFIKGRICKVWLVARDSEIAEKDLRTMSESWWRGLIRRLLERIQRQWLYRNATVHYKVSDGLMTQQHKTIMEEINNMITDVDPTDLLPEHRRLLNVDYEKMGEGKAEHRHIWLAAMEYVVSAANYIIQGARQALRPRYCTGPGPYVPSPRSSPGR